jgi:hypothetical protein
MESATKSLCPGLPDRSFSRVGFGMHNHVIEIDGVNTTMPAVAQYWWTPEESRGND